MGGGGASPTWDGGEVWAEHVPMLHSMYGGLRHMPASIMQSDQDIYAFAEMLERFVASLQEQAKGGCGVPLLTPPALDTLAAAVHWLAHDPNILWLPEYGCALVALAEGDAASSAGAAQLGLQQQAQAPLQVLCLDEWTFQVHSFKDQMQHTAACLGSTVVHGGCVAVADVPRLQQRLCDIMKLCLTNKKDKGAKGHQRTPAFVLAVLQRALAAPNCSADEAATGLLSGGGFTDVGRHTGSDPRDTSWPLVREVLKLRLQHLAPTAAGAGSGAWSAPTVEAVSPRHVFQAALMHLDVWILSRQAERLRPADASATVVTATMQLLEAAALRAAAFADDGVDVSQFEAACRHARARLEWAVAERQLEAARQLELPPITSSNEPSIAYPAGGVPAAVPPPSAAPSADASRKRADMNLGSLPLLPSAGFANARAVLDMLDWTQQHGAVPARHLLRSIERLVFERVASELGGGGGSGGDVIAEAPDACSEVAAMVDLVDMYRRTLHSFLATRDAGACMRVELQSRGVLLAWCAYCLTHAAALKEHPLLGEFGVALAWRDLRHLVLADKGAADAALAVAAYLRRHTRAGREVFALRGARSAPTFEFAERFAREVCPPLMALWASHTAAAAERRAAHWLAVQELQARAKELRESLAEWEAYERAVGGELDGAKARQRCATRAQLPPISREVQALQQKLLEAQGQTRELAARVAESVRAPPWVVQPLPADEGAALRWLFFLHMDEHAPLLRQLARAGFLAQQLLLAPCEPAAKAPLEVVPHPTSLVGHYNAHQLSTRYPTSIPEHRGSDGDLRLMSSLRPPSRIGPVSVDDMFSDADGVWHPDALTPSLTWSGTQCCAEIADELAGFPPMFNPFWSVDAGALVQAYTERLATDADRRALQVFMSCADAEAVAPERGNVAIACQDARPPWLSKPGLLAYGALRAYPLGQLRRLCVALRERSLPLTRPAVVALVRQAVYQLGSLTDEDAPRRLWRTGWERDVLPALSFELGEMAGELADTPREHEAVALLGELAAYLSDYDPSFRALARRFSDMTSRVADLLDSEGAAAGGGDASGAGGGDGKTARAAAEAAAAETCAKQVRWRAMALACHALGELDDWGEDAAAMIRLMVLINHSHAFQEQAALRAQMAICLSRAHGIMATRAPALVAAARRRPSVLTAAVRSVLKFAPQQLDWRQLAYADEPRPYLTSFEAESPDGRLYAINVLDGTVLLDGSPPSRLPRDVTDHPLFRRVFGDANFEVFTSATGVFTTCQPVRSPMPSLGATGAGGAAATKHQADCLYEFALHQPSESLFAAPQLVISELQGTHRLELLDPHAQPEEQPMTDDAPLVPAGWVAALPVRLRELHSHWLCRKEGVILFRPLRFHRREVDFLVRLRSPDAGAGVAAAEGAEVQGGGQQQQYDCRLVPSHLRNVPWPRLLRAFWRECHARLVTATCAFVPVLAKFEDPAFIHTFQAASDAAGGGGDADAGVGAAGNGAMATGASNPAPAPQPARSESAAGAAALSPHHPSPAAASPPPPFPTASSPSPAPPASPAAGPTPTPSSPAAEAAVATTAPSPKRAGSPLRAAAASASTADAPRADNEPPPAKLRRCCLTASLRFQLPRYGLEFELGEDGQLRSRDYAGYRLRQRQQLVRPADTIRSRRLDNGEAAAAADGEGEGEGVEDAVAEYTLPDFVQYLVLERDFGAGGTDGAAGALLGERRAALLVLVPAGEVARDPDGVVRVRVPPDSGAKLQAHCYEVHSRFGNLRANTIPARLQLAALYAATSTLLPEPASAMTGAQMAMELVRQCWVNRPLTPEEELHLHSAAVLGGCLAPGLPLLAHELECSSQQLASLHLSATEGTRGGGGGGSGAASAPAAPPTLHPDLATRYLLAAAPCDWAPNPRLQLTPSEQRRVLGTVRVAPTAPVCVRRGRCGLVDVPAFPGDAAALVTCYEDVLAGLVVQQPVGGAPPEYPLPVGEGGGVEPLPLEREMHSELARSWGVHHRLPRVCGGSVGALAGKLQGVVGGHREAVEEYLQRYLWGVPAAVVGAHGTALRLRRLADAAPTPSRTDLMRIVLQPALLRDLNPLLSPESCRRLRQGALLWLQLCVLEDRVARVAALAAAADPAEELVPELVQELQCRRTWDVEQHPEWLVFEAEGQLQIRPRQHTVAAHLLNNPGAICQLNMGEGKTRVILPLLALQWAKGDCLVRLNFLSTLLDDAHRHLHNHLCASVLGRKLVTLPFNRDVQVTLADAQAMHRCLQYAMQERALLLVAPEWRLSLQLKWHELWPHGGDEEVGAVMQALERVAALPYVDILDESDELLHHRYQLIYACGKRTTLPGLDERISAAQALLRLISEAAAQGVLSETVAALEPPPGRSAGAFAGVRLLPGAALEAAAPALRVWLAERLVEQPPYELRWMAGLDAAAKARIKEFITLPSPPMDASTATTCGGAQPAPDVSQPAAPPVYMSPACSSPERGDASVTVGCDGGATCGMSGGGGAPVEAQAVQQTGQAGQARANAGKEGEGGEDASLPPFLLALTAAQRAHVFVLRGLLAFALLEHALQKRHLVEYGVFRSPKARKRLAVPFRAADTPSERSEFAQPDMALLLTCLSYYYDGLSVEEFHQALRVLLAMAPNAQRWHYDTWLALSAPAILEEELHLIDSAAKVDVTNPEQVARMHAHFSHNMATVNFYLKFCILPAETQQYQQRLLHTAWHLADNPAGRVVGFSGTKDSHRLLPLQVRQHEPADEPALLATDGRMLDVLLEAHAYTCLGGEGPVWQALLDAAVTEGADAILDCGALLAGTSCRAAAEYVLQHPRLNSARFKGACYYDPAQRCWVILDAHGRCLPRHTSPITERDAFVIFDDARCRGADLALRRSAVGVLTLGPGICKDKVMQAAGRLRQLVHRRQTVRFAGGADVTAKIVASGDLGGAGEVAPRHVLHWVMTNTVQATLRGVVQWAAQGLHFAATSGAPARARWPEQLELRALYGGARAPQPVSAVVRRLAQAAGDPSDVGGGGGGLTPRAARLVADVVECSCAHGAGHVLMAGAGGVLGAADEECEREQEREEEVEEEREAQVARVAPLPETSWELSTVVTATAPGDLPVALVPLFAPAGGGGGGGRRRGRRPSGAVALLEPRSIAGIPWANRLWCTPNFLHAVHLSPGQPANEYLRPVDALLSFPSSGDAVLLSEREADGVAAVLWRAQQLAPAALRADTPQLAHLSYLQLALQRGEPHSPMLALGTAAGPPPPHVRMDVPQLASLLLFNGVTMFGSEELLRAVHRLVRRRALEAEQLVAARGRQLQLPRSDLERACDSVLHAKPHRS